MRGTRIERLVALCVSVVVSLGVTAASASLASASQREDSDRIVKSIEDVDAVMFQGEIISLGDYAGLEAEGAGEDSTLHLVVDPSAIERGYFVAFATEADASAYMESHGMGPFPGTQRDSAVESATESRLAAAEAMESLSLPSVALGCSEPNHLGRLYELVQCGGSYFNVLWNEAIPDLRVYGWNDRARSAALGDCIGALTGWIDINYQGDSRSYGGLSLYPTLLPGFAGEISSLKTTAAGPCA